MISMFKPICVAALLRAVCVACFAPLLLAHPGSAAAASPWGDVEKWVGHQPSEALNADGAGFFDLPRVAEQLPRLLTPIKRAVFNSYQQTGSVRRVGHFLVLARCKANDCAAGNITVILDVNGPNIWFVLRVSDDQGAQRCWVGTAEYSALPQALQAAFVD